MPVTKKRRKPIDLIKILSGSKIDLIAAAHQLITEELSIKSFNMYRLDFVCDTLSQHTSFEMRLIQSLLYLLQEDFDKAIDAISEPQTDKKKMMFCDYLLGLIKHKRGDHKEAVQHLNNVVDLSGHNRLIRSYAYNLIGTCYIKLREYVLAESTFQHAINTNVEQTFIDSWYGQAEVRYRPAGLNDLEESRNFLDKALGQNPNDEINRIEYEKGQGIVARYANDLYKAIEHYKKALHIAYERHDVEAFAKLLTNIAESYNRIDRDEERERALLYAKKALEVSRYILDHSILGDRLKICASPYRQFGNYKKSQGLLDEAEQAYTACRTLYQQGIEIAKKLQDSRLEYNLWYNVAVLERDRGHFCAAFEAIGKSYRCVKDISKSKRTKEDQKQISEVFEMYEKLTQRMWDAPEDDKLANWGKTTTNDKYRVDIGSEHYSDYLYKTLRTRLEEVAAKEGRILPDQIAKMLSTLHGEWFKNRHYTYLGFAWTTATQHLKILLDNKVIKMRGHSKGARYRLCPDVCPLDLPEE
ncbi:MAG: hypothetical protein B6244_00965 [Candidatus Cloacimonetes bacterium 4572_55]|nr:MAG: hypothetical protein B6244_00965 [Candidatus Cloacimonetes bacterium 4572_55]